MTRDELREWLDRPPPPRPPLVVDEDEDGWVFVSGWREWFYDTEFLGTRSSRTGPDPVGAVQRCGCEQCSQQTDVQRGTMEES